MASEVGSGQVAIFPVFKGFRRAVDAEVDGSAKSASTRFASGFKSAGDLAGRGFSSGFKASTQGVSSDLLRSMSAEVAKASRDVSAARLKELDAAGRVRVAETQLIESKAKYASGSLQVVRAEERLATTQRALAATEANVSAATDRLASAKRNLASATESATSSGRRMTGVFAQLPGELGQAGGNSARRFSQGFLDVLGGALGANIITGIGFTIGRGINQGIGAALNYGFQGVNLASELEQSVGAVESVFKDHAGAIQGFSVKARTSVGLSQAAYQKFATVVGAQLKNLKIPFDQVAGQTDSLITLGADLAAQFGGSTSDAVSALSSLLRGERDPIERYGVGIKQADINARLAAQGLQDLTGDALRQAEIQATLAILWEQTADAQGTFFKESDTYAHKQQVLNASLEEAQTKLGGFLLPAFTAVSEYANTTLLPRVDQIIDRVGPKLEAALDTAGPAAERLLDKVAPLVESFIVWGGEEGIPAVIGTMDEMADAAPGWAAALDTLGNPNSDFNKWFEEFVNGPANFHDDVLVPFFETPVELPWSGILGPLNLKDGGEEAADEIVSGFASGMRTADGWVRASESSKTNAAKVAAAAAGFKVEMFLSGANYGDSLAEGIASKQIKVGLAGLQIGQEAVRQTKAGLRIASPSKEGLEAGANYGSSIATGISSQVAAVRASTQELVAATAFDSSSAMFLAPGTTPGTTPGDRPIFADGIGLIGWIRTLANGEAKLVFNQLDAAADSTIRGRVIR